MALLVGAGCAAHRPSRAELRDAPWLAPREEPARSRRSTRAKIHREPKIGYVIGGAMTLDVATVLTGFTIGTAVRAHESDGLDTFGYELAAIAIGIPAVCVLITGAFLLSRGLAGDEEPPPRTRQQIIRDTLAGARF
ncbi:MAG TPA: hypothetical protein VFF06_22620 [Polyangia bacterium]|nr:hypothetical protein [Polyangia bacterium]